MDRSIADFYEGKGYTLLACIDEGRYLFRGAKNFYYLWESNEGLPNRFSRLMLHRNNEATQRGVEMCIEPILFDEIPMSEYEDKHSKDRNSAVEDFLMEYDETLLSFEAALKMLRHVDDTMGLVWKGRYTTEDETYLQLETLIGERNAKWPERDNWMDWAADTRFEKMININTNPIDEHASRSYPIPEDVRQIYIDQDGGIWSSNFDDNPEVHKINMSKPVLLKGSWLQIEHLEYGHEGTSLHQGLEVNYALALYKYWQFTLEIPAESMGLVDLLRTVKVVLAEKPLPDVVGSAEI